MRRVQQGRSCPADYQPNSRDTKNFFKKLADVSPGDEVILRGGEMRIMELYDANLKQAQLWNPLDDVVTTEAAWNIRTVAGISNAPIIG